MTVARFEIDSICCIHSTRVSVSIYAVIPTTSVRSMFSPRTLDTNVLCARRNRSPPPPPLWTTLTTRTTNLSFIVLHCTVPVCKRRVRATEVRLELMQEQTGVVSAEKVSKQFRRLSSATLHIDGAQDCNDIFQQKLGIVRPARPITSF